MNKLAPPRSNLSHSSPQKSRGSLGQDDDDDDEKGGKIDNVGGWGFIQALTHMSHAPKEIKETEKIYVHPMDKSSSLILSKKSLEMCTESLGSESGSVTSESIEELSSNNFRPIQRSRTRELYTKKSAERGIFPPPLSSIRGSDTVQVWPHRQGGRLVIKAGIVNSSNCYFRAERCDGRLRLSLFTRDDEDEDEDEEEEEEEEEEEVEEEGGGGIEGGDEECSSEDMDGNNGCEIGISRPSRCKESGNGKEDISSWAPFLVVIIS